MRFIHILLASALIFCGCTTSTQLSSSQQAAIAALLNPPDVQLALAVGGAAIMKYIPAADKAAVHTFATTLQALTVGQLDAATIAPLMPVISPAAAPYLNPLINGALIDINLALLKFGQHNASVLAYTQAISQGLLSAGF
jgi:hypothetical protein